MSGHSKWSKVKHIKAVKDVRKGKAFSKAAADITVAARGGGGDPRANPVLVAAIAKARAVNLPKDRIEGAIAKAVGRVETGEGQELVLEGYGPEGVAVMVTAFTDNRNRTTAQVRKIFTRGGGALGEVGSASYIFKGSEPLFEVKVPSGKKESVENLIAALWELPEVGEVRSNLGGAN